MDIALLVTWFQTPKAAVPDDFLTIPDRFGCHTDSIRIPYAFHTRVFAVFCPLGSTLKQRFISIPLAPNHR